MFEPGMSGFLKLGYTTFFMKIINRKFAKTAQFLAVRLLSQILKETASGHAVSVVPVD